MKKLLNILNCHPKYFKIYEKNSKEALKRQNTINKNH